MGYRLNRLDEAIFMAGPKPMRTEFGIRQRLESCVGFMSLAFVINWRLILLTFTVNICFLLTPSLCSWSHLLEKIVSMGLYQLEGPEKIVALSFSSMSRILFTVILFRKIHLTAKLIFIL